jgi:valyl-tRNA synthetase
LGESTRPGELATRYRPEAVEAKWYAFWEREGFFRPAEVPDAPVFSMVIPPPNVTGVLHLGHALNNTWQDILARYHRMRGEVTLWLPGTDHAGIHTQIKVEEALRERGLSREALGREAFLAEVWAWREKYGGIILDQLKKLGCSLDWSRLRFTLDAGLSRAVTEVFVRLYEEGLIYRGEYIINWCVSCRTALSDIEVDHEEQPGRLWRIRYPIAEGGFVEVATTRPETMLGDTAVAVHPADARYRHLVGRHVVLPLMGRSLPVVADEYVDPAYGTGVVKVTPAHDPNDFAIGERHGLPRVKVIGEDGRMTAEAGPYAGLTREEARQRVLADLAAQGLLVGEEAIVHAVGHCQRCGTVIEPLVSRQWFVRMRPLAEPALEAVESGRVRFVPERFTKIYRNWLENIHDWCISRQIWWGHRIPAYYCQDCGETVVARSAPTVCPVCGGVRFEQDPDVLDTWFSSALWPFSTLGWPERTPDLARFYPTTVLSTGYDIIFFWVARMIMQGLHFTGEVPFRTVLLHGLIRDAEGRKMSKSLGNGIDPVEVIDRYGADALRMSLVTGNAPGNDLRFSVTRVEAGQHLANKIWNAVRFLRLNLDGPPEVELAVRDADHWILQELDATVTAATDLLDRFEFGEAARAVTDFFWDRYCDWYIEAVKWRLKDPGPDGRAARYTLWRVAERALRLLHPFMPFVTEELWQALPHEGKSIMVAPWPKPEGGFAPQRAEAFALAQDAVRTLRNLRAELGLATQQRVEAVLVPADGTAEAAWRANAEEIRNLAQLSNWRIATAAQRPHPALMGVTAGGAAYIPLAGVVDLARERERLGKELDGVRRERTRLEARLADDNFRTRAPADVVAETTRRLEAVRARETRLVQRLEELG